MGHLLQLIRVALRNVLRNRRRSVLTMLAIAIAVAVLVFVRGTLNGLQGLLKDRVIYGQTGVVQVHKKGFIANVKKSPLQFAFPVAPALLAKVKSAPGVEAVAPRIAFATMVSVGDTTLFSLGFGIDPALEYEVCPVKKKDIGEGSAVSAGASVLTPELRTQLGSKQGDELTLMAPDFDGTLNGGLVKVGGFLRDNPAFSGDKKLLFVSLATAQELLRLDGQATELAVSAADPEAADQLKAAVEAAVGPEYEVHTWRDLAKFVVDALKNQEFALGFVIMIFSLVALFGILNTMLMTVMARTKEIGTMMAVGVKRRAILVMIVSEAAILGGLGALLGGAIGVSVVMILNKVGLEIRPPGATVADTIRPVIATAFVIRAVIVAITGAALASLYPAWRASRLTPVQALSSL